MWTKVFSWIMLALFASMFIAVLIIIGSGCQFAQPKPEPVPIPPNPIITVINSTDWFMSLMMVASVVSLFAAFNGLKVGWAGLAACIGGMVLKAALSSVYVFWICGIIFIVSVLLALASIFLKNKALREIITGVQVVRNSLDKDQKETITTVLSSEQGLTTKGLVNKVKNNLKRKGVL